MNSYLFFEITTLFLFKLLYDFVQINSHFPKFCEICFSKSVESKDSWPSACLCLLSVNTVYRNTIFSSLQIETVFLSTDYCFVSSWLFCLTFVFGPKIILSTLLSLYLLSPNPLFQLCLAFVPHTFWLNDCVKMT